jgi:hypothetical protein
MVDARVLVNCLAVPDRLCDVLDGFSDAAEGLELILCQGALFLLHPGAWAGLLGPSMMMVSDSYVSAASLGEGVDVPRGPLESIANLPVAIPPNMVSILA